MAEPTGTNTKCTYCGRETPPPRHPKHASICKYCTRICMNTAMTVEILRRLLNSDIVDVACDYIAYDRVSKSFDLEWIGLPGWRVSASVYDDGDLVWAASLGKDRRKGTDLDGLIAALVVLERLAYTPGLR